MRCAIDITMISTSSEQVSWMRIDRLLCYQRYREFRHTNKISSSQLIESSSSRRARKMRNFLQKTLDSLSYQKILVFHVQQCFLFVNQLSSITKDSNRSNSISLKQCMIAKSSSHSLKSLRRLFFSISHSLSSYQLQWISWIVNDLRLHLNKTRIDQKFNDELRKYSQQSIEQRFNHQVRISEDIETSIIQSRSALLYSSSIFSVFSSFDFCMLRSWIIAIAASEKRSWRVKWDIYTRWTSFDSYVSVIFARFIECSSQSTFFNLCDIK